MLETVVFNTALMHHKLDRVADCLLTEGICVLDIILCYNFL